MRQFYLENELGQQYQLNSSGTGFMTDPKGLGYKLNTSYTRIGSSWHRNKMEDAQATISCKLVFGTDSPYVAIQEALRFIRQSKELVLHRITPAGEYLKDVDLVSMDISEIGEGNYLTVNVSFAAKSLWYSKVNVTYNVIEDMTNAKKYTHKYPYKYLANSGGSLTIENNGSVDAPMVFFINGPVVNPVALIKVGNEELFRVKITAEATANEIIEWSSRDGKIFCEKVSANGVRTNLVPNFDINNANFFKAPVGASVLKFSADSAITAPIRVTMYKQYRAV